MQTVLRNASAKNQSFDACVGPKFLHCLRTAWPNQAELRNLEGFHARCPLTTVGVPHPHASRVSNCDVLRAASCCPYPPTAHAFLEGGQSAILKRDVNARFRMRLRGFDSESLLETIKTDDELTRIWSRKCSHRLNHGLPVLKRALGKTGVSAHVIWATFSCPAANTFCRKCTTTRTNTKCVVFLFKYFLVETTSHECWHCIASCSNSGSSLELRMKNFLYTALHFIACLQLCVVFVACFLALYFRSRGQRRPNGSTDAPAQHCRVLLPL